MTPPLRQIPASFEAPSGTPSALSGGTLRVSSSMAAPAAPPVAHSGGSGPLMYGTMELGPDRTLELRIGYHDVVIAALKR